MSRPFIFLALATLLVACKPQPATQHSTVHKVADYLYETTYTNIDESIYDEPDLPQMEAACSSVRHGNFHGRNLDLFFNEGCEVVVHTTHTDHRLASVAVCGALPQLTAEVIENAEPTALRWLPFLALDGINEKGVAINVNVVPSSDYPVATGTSPGARRINMGLMVRYLLDRAESAEHAWQLLHEVDLHGGMGTEWGLHLMISDARETCIVEVINNELRCTRGESICNSNIMTNLYSTLLPDLTPHAEGVERYHILQDNYAEGATEEGMAHLMQRVRYTQTYERETNPFWFSECCGIYTNDDGTTTDITLSTDHDFIWQYIQPSFENYEHHQRDNSYWQTVNTSVYNLSERTLLLFVQEDYTHSYRFKVEQDNL